MYEYTFFFHSNEKLTSYKKKQSIFQKLIQDKNLSLVFFYRQKKTLLCFKL